MAEIISGKEVALKVKAGIKSAIEAKKITPCLTVVLVGSDPASVTYVKNKKKACDEVGIKSVEHHLPEDTNESDLLKLIERLNNDKNVHGILVQLPLPKQIDTQKVLNAVIPSKDVDGFHPVNAGKLLSGDKTGFRPCTPLGIIELIESTGCDISGKHAVVVGRSNIVGKPVAIMLLEKNATVTVCHSKTKNLADVVQTADIVVAAIGRPQFIKGGWIKNGTIVIDVGINRTSDGKIVGDVEFGTAEKHAGFITPVPGGVGPMTIAMLLKNTLKAYETNTSL